MDIAERYGADLRLLLDSADFLRDAAIFFGSDRLNTLGSKASALLSRVTRADQ